MIKNIFPFGNGAGIYDGQKLCVCIVDQNGEKRVGGENLKKREKIFSFPFFRGILFYFFDIYLYFKSYLIAKKLENKNEENLKKINVTKNISLTSDFIIFLGGIILAFIIALVGFKFFPIFIFNKLFNYPTNYFFKCFFIGVIKVLIIFIVFFILKVFPFTKDIYSFNGAGCQQLAEKNKKELLVGRTYPLNFLNFLFFTSVLSVFVLSLFSFKIFWLLQTLINIAIYLLIISIGYEFLNLITKTKYAYLKDIALLTNFFVCNKPKTTHSEVIRVIKKEMTNYSDFQEIENDKIPMSSVYAEMETKLRAKDKFEESDVDWIIANVLGKSRCETKLCRFVSPKEYRDIMKCCERKAKGEPLSSIFGFVEFYGLKFDVNKKVLSPRMETEILVEEVIKKIKEHSFENILDLCTGSGAIAVSIAKDTNCKVTASDISKQALSVAENNAKKNEVKIDFICSDLFNSLKKNKKYDIIVSNPPYIKRDEIEKLDVEVKNYDPKLALDGGEDGLDFYRKIVKDCQSKLKNGGYLFFELGQGQWKDVQKMLEENGFEDIAIKKDYNKIERIIYGRKRT